VLYATPGKQKERGAESPKKASRALRLCERVKNEDILQDFLS